MCFLSFVRPHGSSPAKLGLTPFYHFVSSCCSAQLSSFTSGRPIIGHDHVANVDNRISGGDGKKWGQRRVEILAAPGNWAKDYDANCWPKSATDTIYRQRVADQAGNAMQYTYDGANQLASVIQANHPDPAHNTTAPSAERLRPGFGH